MKIIIKCKCGKELPISKQFRTTFGYEVITGECLDCKIKNINEGRRIQRAGY